MGRGRAGAAALVCGSLLVAGCASIGTRSVTSQPAEVFPAWTGCAAQVPAQELMQSNDRPEQGRVPDGFTPVRAVECRRDDPDQRGRLRGVQLTAGDISGLVAELARPSERSAPGSSVSCTADAWLRPWLFLVDAQGRWVIPQVPSDVCSHPLRAEQGHPEPTWKRQATWLPDPSALLEIRRLGCQPRETLDGILLDPDQGNDHRAAIPLVELSGRVTSVCRYRVLPRHAGLTQESHFASADPLTADQAAAVRAAVVEQPAAECHQTATSYATLQGVGDTIAIAVELDGCRRMLETYASDHDHRVAAATPELVALLAG